MSASITINKYLPIAFIYFFFNSLFLPLGLLYTTLLTPLFLYWIYLRNGMKYVLLFFIITLPWAIIHLINGVDIFVYFKSYILLFTAVVFGIAFYLFYKEVKDIRHIFSQLAGWNFLFVIMAVILLLTGMKSFLWSNEPISPGITDIPRLKLFTYEASYYSLLLVPIVFYYYLKVLFFKTSQPLVKIAIVTIPLILSFSFGVLLGVAFALFFLFCSDIKLFFVKKRFPKYILLGSLVFLLIFILLVKYYPDNAVFKRFANIFEGNDSSFKGRTTDSFFLGWKMAEMKSILFGCGLGQVKILGLETFTEFYKHSFTTGTVKIPNSMGETLAMFGILGFFLRLLVEIYLFFRTKVSSNYYRLCIFLFAFIYQFTGSFLNNVAEYVLWVIAFTPAFTEFDKKRVTGAA